MDAIFKRSATSEREYAYVFTGYINKLRASDKIDQKTQLHIVSVIICRVIVKKSMLSLLGNVCFEVTIAKTSGCRKMYVCMCVVVVVWTENSAKST